MAVGTVNGNGAGSGDGLAMASRLAEYVRNAGLKEGDRLPSIRELSEVLGEGPSAIRDGLLAAQTRGIVKIHPRVGAFVCSLDFGPMVEALSDGLETAIGQQDHNLMHLIEARHVIELQTVKIATERCRIEDLYPLYENIQLMKDCGDSREVFIGGDENFHLGIAQLAGNPVLVTILKSILTLLRPYRMKYAGDSDARAQTQRSHEVLYSFIKAGDSESACREMDNHIAFSRQDLISRF